MSRVITVAQDGSGEFCTVQQAVDAVPLGNKCRTIIRLSPGVYQQPVYIAKTKNFITFAGLSPEHTILTANNTATNIQHHQQSKVIGTGTFACGTVIVEGEDFIAENVTFENSAPQGSGQAVALRVTADRCAFYNCRFLGWQDTLYLHYGKQYLRDCYIEGSVDFIFGNSTALLEHCHIHCKSEGFITAQSRKSSQETTGYVFLRCVITGNGKASYAILDGHGDLLEGWFLHTLTWISVLGMKVGTIGASVRMKGVLASTSTGVLDRGAVKQRGLDGQGNWWMKKQFNFLCIRM